MELADLIPKKEAAEIVASTSRISLRSTMERIMKRHDFPKPKRVIGRAALYSKQEIERWLTGGK